MSKKRILILDEEELGIIINSLNEFTNMLIRNGENSGALDEILLKVVEAPSKKLLFSRKCIEER